MSAIPVKNNRCRADYCSNTRYRTVLAARLSANEEGMPKPAPDVGYSHLIRRSHPWRRQLSFMGRRLTVGEFLESMRAEKWTPEEAAHQYELPVAAVYEAVRYGEQNASLLLAEHAREAG
jgi:uncharacterized protein (DUF433 family)